MNKLIKKKIHSTELIWQTDLLNMSFWEAPILKTLQVASQLIESQRQRPMELAPPSVISHRLPHPPLLFFSHTDLAVGQGQQEDLHAPALGPLHRLSSLSREFGPRTYLWDQLPRSPMAFSDHLCRKASLNPRPHTAQLLTYFLPSRICHCPASV